MIDVQIFIKKNTFVINGTVTSANSSPYLTITNSSAGFTTNQYKGHYVKITKGTGLGSVAWIVSNTATVLTLQTGIQVNSGSGYKIYRADYQKLDLYKSEKISVTSQIANANDIGKVFTDYSQSFTIPASVRNNKILSHWYESTVDDGFDHRVRYDGYVEINSQRFKDGNFQLEKATKKNGFIESYTVTFYGNLTQLKDRFKDIKLRDLISSNGINYWDLLNHTYNSTQVKNKIIATTLQNVYYPLIGSQRKFYYKNGVALQDITLATAPIKWNELFPAVPMTGVFAFIQSTFGITFTGSFFSLDQWTKLYLYLKNAEILVIQTEIMRLIPNTIAVGSFPELSNGIITTNWNFATSLTGAQIKIQLTVIPTDLTLDYTLYIYKNNLLYKTFKKEDRVSSSAGDAFQIDLYSRATDPNNNVYEFKITSSGSNSFKSSFWYWRYNNGAITSFTRADTTVAQPTISNINIKNFVPDIKIADFISGIIKAFNLMIIPKDLNTYEFVPLELYYNAGKITDITKYIYADEMEIERPKLFRSINFEYEKSTNVLNNKFKGLWGTEYGDLIYNPISSNESATYDVKLPFEDVLFERTVDENFLTATLIDKDLKPYTPKPMLIYRNDLQTLSTPVILTTETSTTTFNTYNRFSNEYNSIPADVTFYSGLMTMNFSNEQSPWYNILAPQGLYYRHYKNYIDNLYNIKTRIIKVKALLPPSLMTSKVLKGQQKSGIALNDRLIIRNKRYIINSLTTDLTSGEANLELITDYRGVNASNTVGYRYANYSNIQTDRVALNLDAIIYLNDYDSFGIKGAENYLVYTVASDLKADYVLNFDIPYNGSGLDRDDRIGIEYFIAGVPQITEYIYITQTAI